MAYNHISVDIETLDVTSKAVVLSIGAVAFNLEDNQSFEDLQANPGFYTELQVQPQLDEGRLVSASTLHWWINQNATARKVFSKEDSFKQQPSRAVEDFASFVKNTGASYLWGNGNMFDNVILRSLFADFEASYPVHFVADLDLRTLRIAAKEPQRPTVSMTAHNALDDALYQALCAQHYYGLLHGSQT